MTLPVAVAVAMVALVPQDTVLVLGVHEADLTGDGEVEVLRVVGVGASIDSLAVTFTIESAGETLFAAQLSPLTRTVGFDAGRRRLSRAEHLQRLEDFGAQFFREDRFRTPAEFLDMLNLQLRRHVALIPVVIARDRRRRPVMDSLAALGLAPGQVRLQANRILSASDTTGAGAIWNDIQSHGGLVFQFSPGGDTSLAIGWSEADHQFYRLLECC